MKVWQRLALVLVLFIALVSCGIGDSPEKAAQEWIEALVSMDGNTLMARTCAAQQGYVQEAGLWYSLIGMFGQSFTGQQAEVDLSDLNFKTVKRSGDTAQVRVTGEMRVAILAVAQSQYVDEVWTMVREEGKWKWCGP